MDIKMKLTTYEETDVFTELETKYHVPHKVTNETNLRGITESIDFVVDCALNALNHGENTSYTIDLIVCDYWNEQHAIEIHGVWRANMETWEYSVSSCVEYVDTIPLKSACKEDIVTSVRDYCIGLRALENIA